MANTKISALPTAVTILTSDLLAVVSDPGGTPVTVQAPISQVLAVGGGGGGALVLLDQQTAAASAALDFTTSITSAYDVYVIEIVGVRPTSGSGASLVAQVSTNGGSTWQTTLYSFGVHYVSNVGAGADYSGSTINLGGNVKVGGTGLDGSVRVYDPLAARATQFVIATAFEHDDTNRYAFHGAGHHSGSVSVDALRFKFDTGVTIAAGVIRMYGVAQ